MKKTPKWSVGDELKISGTSMWHNFTDNPDAIVIDVTPDAVFQYLISTGDQNAWVHEKHLCNRDGS